MRQLFVREVENTVHVSVSDVYERNSEFSIDKVLNHLCDYNAQTHCKEFWVEEHCASKAGKQFERQS